jgi:WD40 repeat protein
MSTAIACGAWCTGYSAGSTTSKTWSRTLAAVECGTRRGGYSYGEIAGFVGRSEPSVRQTARRACEHVEDHQVRYDTDQSTRAEVTERFHCVRGVAFSPDGTGLEATGSGDHTGRIWDAHTGSQHRSIGSYRDPIWSLAWTPDGDRLVFATGDGTVRVWDVTRLREVAELRGHDQSTWSVTVSPDGTRAVTGSGDTTARIWAL